MNKNFTDSNHLERRLLRARLKLLDHKWEQVAEDQRETYLDWNFTLTDVETMGAVIRNLNGIHTVHD